MGVIVLIAIIDTVLFSFIFDDSRVSFQTSSETARKNLHLSIGLGLRMCRA